MAHASMNSLRQLLLHYNDIIIITGNGISLDFDIPTERILNGYWRRYRADSLVSSEAFYNNPSLVWEFYEYRKKILSRAKPTKVHETITAFQKRFAIFDKKVQILTLNVDGLHQKSGAKDVVELYGNIFETICTKCSNIEINEQIPTCPALKGKGSPNRNIKSSNIPIEELPTCRDINCKGLLKPNVHVPPQIFSMNGKLRK